MPITLNGTTGVVTPAATVGSLNGILKATNGVVSNATASDYNSTLSASPMVAKAWVNFDGKGFGATYPVTSASVIRSGYNVSSVTEVALGKYEINFTAPLATNTYAFALGLSATAAGSGGANGNGETILQDGVFSTTKFGLQVMYNAGLFPRESSIVTGIFFSI